MTIDTLDGIDLDAIVGLKPQPAAPATEALGAELSRALATATSPAAIMCRDQLSTKLQEAARNMALQVLPQIIANPNLLAEVGSPAVEEINTAAEQLFHTFLSGDRVKIPELTEYTKTLDRAVRGFTDKHGKNKANVEKYDQIKTKVLDWIGRNRDWLNELISDAKGLERRMDGVIAQIIDKQAQLVRNVELCNQLYTINERAIVKLTFACAMLEYLREEAGKAAEAIVVDPSAPDSRTKREEKDVIVTLAQQIEVRLSEFKQRLFVAVATSPQIRNIRTLNYGLSQRLAMIITLTIPVFKLTVVQWAMAIEAEQGAQMTEAGANFNNDVMNAWAASSAQMVPAMARVIQTPSTRPDTIMAVANSLVAQFEGFDAAYKAGIQQRIAVDVAIAQGQAAIAASADRRADVLRELTAANKPVELPVAPVLPQEVRDNAAEALAQAA